MAPLDVDSLCVQDYNGDHYHHAHCRGWFPLVTIVQHVKCVRWVLAQLYDCHGHGRSWQDREEPQSANDSNITGRGVKPLDRPHMWYVACRNLDLQGAWLSQFHHTSPCCSQKNRSMARKSRNSKLLRMASMAQRKRLDWLSRGHFASERNWIAQNMLTSIVFNIIDEYGWFVMILYEFCHSLLTHRPMMTIDDPRIFLRPGNPCATGHWTEGRGRIVFKQLHSQKLRYLRCQSEAC